MIKNLLEEYYKKFTKNELDLEKSLEARFGFDIACCLVSLKHREITSFKEIEVIADLIEQFKPLTIKTFSDTPKKIVINGITHKKYSVEITPQYKVKNPFPNGRTWSIDLAIRLLRDIGGQFIDIGTLGIEYDGDPSHYLESGIKKAYLRDSHIAAKEQIQIIRISPDQWKKDNNYYITAIKKFCENKIKTAEKIQYHTVMSLIDVGKDHPINPRLIKCPLCLGEGVLASDLCPVCSGVGAIKESLKVDLSAYSIFDCPDCKYRKNTNPACRTCNGLGHISRDKAITIAKNRA